MTLTIWVSTFAVLALLMAVDLGLPVWVSLAAIVAVVGGAVAASPWRDRARTPEPHELVRL